VECESKSDTGNNKGIWNHLKITQTIPEQHSGKARNQGTTENRHTGHCTHTAVSANVEVQNIFHRRNNITCGINCKYRRAVILYTVETGFVSGI